MVLIQERRISMCNQMVTSLKGSRNYYDLEKARVKLFTDSMSIPFDYLSISYVTNDVRNRGFLTCLSWFYRIHLKFLELKFVLTNVFDKTPVKILFMCSLVC